MSYLEKKSISLGAIRAIYNHHMGSELTQLKYPRPSPHARTPSTSLPKRPRGPSVKVLVPKLPGGRVAWVSEGWGALSVKDGKYVVCVMVVPG